MTILISLDLIPHILLRSKKEDSLKLILPNLPRDSSYKKFRLNFKQSSPLKNYRKKKFNLSL